MGSSSNKEKDYPLLLCSFEIGNEEQKSYCIKVTRNFNHEKPIRFEISSKPHIKFNISFVINNKTYIIQEIFDNSDEALEESLNKMYKLLDREDISEKSNKKKNDISIKTKQNKKYEKTIFFESTDQRINYKLYFNEDSIFKDIEEELYKKFPEYKSIKKYFLYNGNMIDINKSFEENKIKDNSHILLVMDDMSSISSSLSSLINK